MVSSGGGGGWLQSLVLKHMLSKGRLAQSSKAKLFLETCICVPLQVIRSHWFPLLDLLQGLGKSCICVLLLGMRAECPLWIGYS